LGGEKEIVEKSREPPGGKVETDRSCKTKLLEVEKASLKESDRVVSKKREKTDQNEKCPPV